MTEETITNAEAIQQGLLTDRQIWEIWNNLERSAKEWCEWLKEEYAGEEG